MLGYQMGKKFSFSENNQYAYKILHFIELVPLEEKATN